MFVFVVCFIVQISDVKYLVIEIVIELAVISIQDHLWKRPLVVWTHARVCVLHLIDFNCPFLRLKISSKSRIVIPLEVFTTSNITFYTNRQYFSYFRIYISNQNICIIQGLQFFLVSTLSHFKWSLETRRDEMRRDLTEL